MGIEWRGDELHCDEIPRGDPWPEDEYVIAAEDRIHSGDVWLKPLRFLYAAAGHVDEPRF
jgi:hypothetical protein